jgi:hypothetical protein
MGKSEGIHKARHSSDAKYLWVRLCGTVVCTRNLRPGGNGSSLSGIQVDHLRDSRLEISHRADGNILRCQSGGPASSAGQGTKCRSPIDVRFSGRSAAPTGTGVWDRKPIKRQETGLDRGCKPRWGSPTQATEAGSGVGNRERMGGRDQDGPHGRSSPFSFTSNAMPGPS